ncbi:hypothetical protein, partial [Yersinia enterocolitica]
YFRIGSLVVTGVVISATSYRITPKHKKVLCPHFSHKGKSGRLAGKGEYCGSFRQTKVLREDNAA